MKVNNHINKRLIDFFREKGINQIKISERTGLSQQTLSLILNDKINPKTSTVEKILSSFPEINATWLLTGKELLNNTSIELEDTSKVEQAKIIGALETEVQYLKNRIQAADKIIDQKDEDIKFIRDRIRILEDQNGQMLLKS